ncbi:hypothetical protein CL630_02310 [bacterium]|nr:hypothetical protein [bacterium]
MTAAVWGGILSWTANGGVWWAILHAILNWGYVAFVFAGKGFLGWVAGIAVLVLQIVLHRAITPETGASKAGRAVLDSLNTSQRPRD